jgi:hypothetical protein
MRKDTEPNFFTFHTFNDIGEDTYMKLTKSDYTQPLDLDAEGNYDIKHALKRETQNN